MRLQGHRKARRPLLSALIVALLTLSAVLMGAGAANATPGRPMITLDPANDLVNGDLVTAKGSGFKKRARLIVMQTVTLPGTGIPTVQTNSRQVTADANGSFSTEFIVRQTFARVDCAKVTCTIAAVAAPPQGVADRSQDASAPLEFRDGAGPLLIVAPHEPLREGSEIEVAGTGFVKGSKLQLAQTVARPDDGRPGEHNRPVAITADGAGRFAATLKVSAKIGNVNCVKVDCFVAAYPTDPNATDKDNDAWTPLDFDGSDGTTLTVDRDAIDQFETAIVSITGAHPLDRYKIEIDGPAPFSAQPFIVADEDGHAALLLMSDVQQAAGEYSVKLTTERTGNVTDVSFSVGPSPLFKPAEGAPTKNAVLAENYGEGFGKGQSSAEAAAEAAGNNPQPQKNRWYLIPIGIIAAIWLVALAWFARDRGAAKS